MSSYENYSPTGSLPTSVVIIETTFSSLDLAQSTAQALIESHVAACCHIYPSITSVYKWQEKIHTENEIVVKIKTNYDYITTACNLIKKYHTYTVPQIIIYYALPHPESLAYNSWITTQTSKS